MSNKALPRTHRYSRPPSLSTISSNEEADFSATQRNRQTFQSAYTVSPLEDQFETPYYHSHPPRSTQEGLPPPVLYEDRSVPHYLPAYQREQSTSDTYHSHNQYSARNLNEEKEPNVTVEQPKVALTKPHSFDLPQNMGHLDMERADTGFSGYSSSSKIASNTRDVSPGGTPTPKYMKTRFMWMLLQLDQVPWWHNLLAAASAWIILAAYLVVPGTFSSLSQNNENSDTKSITNGSQGQIDAVTNEIVRSINHLGLLIFSAILASAGALMCLVLYFLHWQNYVWLSGKIFQPMMLNALAGLLTTVVNVMTAQKGVWSITAKINAAVTGGVVGVAGSLFLYYNFVLIEGVRKQHRKHFPIDVELVDPIKQRRIGRYLPTQKGF